MNEQQNDEPKVFRTLVRDASKLVKSLQKEGHSKDYTQERLEEHFPGLVQLSRELGNDIPFLAEAGAGCDMMAATLGVKDEAAVSANMNAAIDLNQSEAVGSIHRNSVRFAIILGLELGYILAKMYEQEQAKETQSKDKSFEEFMKGLYGEPGGGE